MYPFYKSFKYIVTFIRDFIMLTIIIIPRLLKKKKSKLFLNLLTEYNGI